MSQVSIGAEAQQSRSVVLDATDVVTLYESGRLQLKVALRWQTFIHSLRSISKLVFLLRKILKTRSE